MDKQLIKQIFRIVLALFIVSCSSNQESKELDKLNINTLEELATLFKHPPNQYRSAPLWVWNDDVTEKQIDRQLADFKAGGMGGVFIHPRPGLITEYLSEDWFSLCNYTVQKGKELGMDVWLYDENSYPSGFAGGHVPAEMPESYNQGAGLKLHKVETLPENANTFFLVLKQSDSKFINITDKLDDEKNKKGDYYLYEKSFYKNQAWHGGYSYVDLLYEGVTEKFIELTMTGYEKAIGSEFGKTVPGIFTDEPNISSPGGLRWTPSLFKDFEKRWGYDLKTNLPSLDYETGDWKRIRHNYYTTLLELFIERWSKPWYNYTEKNNLDWTGHYWEHGWPNPKHGGDNMAMYAWHQMPAIDVLMNKYSEDVNAQFGNVRAVKELSSVANQMGRSRTLSETYGAGGWDLRFEDMKRIGDWEYVLGVNFMNQHLSYITLEGARKKDHPQSFSYHEPWWKHYKVQGDYFARLSLALSSGKQINNILIIEPTSTAWMYFSDLTHNNKFSALGPEFQEFVVNLEKNQIEYDLAAENIVKDIGEIKGKNFVVGERSYDIIVIPPTLENLDKPTFELIKTYLKNGGKVISFNGVPDYVDGTASIELKSIAEKYSTQWIDANSLSGQQIYNELVSKTIQFQQPEKIQGKLFHHRRVLDDVQLLFLVNTASNEWSSGTFMIKGKSVNELVLTSGEIIPYYSNTSGNSLEIAFDLPPSGSLLLLISETHTKGKNDNAPAKAKIVKPLNDINIKMTELNVLTLDYCDVEIDGEIEKDIYYFKAADKIFRHYGFEGNPWSSAVQYKTSIIDQNTFADDTGFEVSYPFLVDKKLDVSSLQVVIEHPELWQLSINGRTVLPVPSKYWLDRKFAVYNIGANVTESENRIRLTATKMTVHSEIEPVYILGDFSLEPQKKGWKIVSSKPIKLGSWKEQGYPFYSEAVSYSKQYSINAMGINKRYVVKLSDWRGSVAEVKINNKPAGTIAWPPYELDITDKIKEGNNEISVVVFGTLKNLLGPHHIGAVRGTAWPASFASANKNIPAGDEYDFIDYGLFQDFMLIESDGPAQKVYWRIKKVMSPEFNSIDSISNNPITVSLSTKTDGAEIRYTLDGSTPNRKSQLYTKPLLLRKSSPVTAQSFKKDYTASPITQRKFYIIKKKIDNMGNHTYKNGMEYYYYEGMWSKIPDFELLTELKKGQTYSFNLDKLERRFANFAIEFIGYIKIDKGGKYTFYLSSNDGSKLLINDIPVVDNDGTHGDIERTGQIELTSGLHPFKLQYFDGGGSQSLNVQYKGPGIERQTIPLDKLMHTE